MLTVTLPLSGKGTVRASRYRAFADRDLIVLAVTGATAFDAADLQVLSSALVTLGQDRDPVPILTMAITKPGILD